jgi:signal transduction histidine kinase
LKIKFYQSIWWKLLFYYFTVILLLMTFFYFAATFTIGRFMESEHQADIETKTDRIAELLSEMPVEKTGDLKKNILIFSQMSNLSLQFIDPQGAIAASAHPRAFPGRPRGEITLVPEEIQKLKLGEKFSHIFHVPGKGQKMLITACPVHQKGVLTGSVVSIHPVGPPPHGWFLLRDSLIIAAAAAIIIAIFFSSSLNKPILKMVKTARNIARGDFSEKMDINRQDELGYLARTFDDMTDQLKKNLESRMKLMSYISHELNTPLTTIQLIAKAMQDGLMESEEKRKSCVDSILGQTRRLSVMVEDIMELSKFEARDVRLVKGEFSPAEAISRAIDTYRLQAGEKGVNIDSIIQDEPLEAWGNRERILQVLQNLLNNAISHNPPGTSVRLSAARQDGKIRFSVSDNGRGIPQDELENIFDRFYKVDKARTTTGSGFGLGLAIVKEILEAHGEKIFVQSSPQGSEFFFFLPHSPKES